MPSAEYEALMIAAARPLAEDEYWCIYHPDGPLELTASKRLDRPVIMVCVALDADWDDLKDQGYQLGRITAAEIDARAASAPSPLAGDQEAGSAHKGATGSAQSAAGARGEGA